MMIYKGEGHWDHGRRLSVARGTAEGSKPCPEYTHYLVQPVESSFDECGLEIKIKNQSSGTDWERNHYHRLNHGNWNTRWTA